MPIVKKVKFLNLLSIAPYMSITAKVSILHRITGFILFLSIPGLLFILHRCLISTSIHQALYANSSQLYLFILYLIVTWSMVFYLCAEIRFLLIDSNIGVTINKARLSGWVVVVASIILTSLLGGLIW